MGSKSLHSVAHRVALGGTDPLAELRELTDGCLLALDRLRGEAAVGRVSQEAVVSLTASVLEGARSACEIVRSRKSGVDSVLRDLGATRAGSKETG